ncbi:MAG: biotin/lipoyl-containing protein [Bacillota bacterium]|jgi:biotin carboxyl carrier protein
MKKFNVIVNGEAFDVEIEEIGGAAPASVPAAAPRPVAPRPAAPAPAPAAPKPAATGGANEVTSPLPGTVLNIVAKEGQAVKAGDLVLVLEAMKMENEVVAPQDGTVKSIPVKKGESVQTGDLLFTMG